VSYRLDSAAHLGLVRYSTSLKPLKRVLYMCVTRVLYAYVSKPATLKPKNLDTANTHTRTHASQQQTKFEAIYLVPLQYSVDLDAEFAIAVAIH
jgi:hypothetical protein